MQNTTEVPQQTTAVLSFREWLRRFERRDSQIGDLARDVTRDASFPVDVNDIDRLEGHLIIKHACREARQTLRRAWRMYQKFLAARANP